jgi:hypothetical protein
LDVKQYSVALEDGDVLDKPEVVTRLRIREQDIILSLHYEAGNVEGSEADPCIVVRRIVPTSGEMVQSRRKINDQVAVNEDLELSDPVFEVVDIESLEGQEDRLARRRSHRESH